MLEGPLFVYALREQVNLQKQIFVLELEKGSEVAIPRELSQCQLPLCYQYYDCLLEIIRQHVSSDSKYYFFKYRQQQQNAISKTPRTKPVLAKGTALSRAEQVSRFIKKKFQNNTHIDDEDYYYKLKLYSQSGETQNGQYAQIRNKELRLKHVGANQVDEFRLRDQLGQLYYSCPSRQSQATLPAKKKFKLKEMSHGKIVDIGEFSNIEESVIQNPNVQVVCEYLTGQQVGKKRKHLFAKKILYQNQLSSLKEKGKRLLLCEKIDREMNNKKNEFLAMAENKNDESLKQLTGQELKEAVERLENVCDVFNDQTLSTQEENIQNIRTNLIRTLYKAKTFDGRTQIINNKIEYDQRFFNHGYSGFQVIISDIRKQIRINEELMRLKKKVNNFCSELEDQDIKVSEGAPEEGHGSFLPSDPVSESYEANSKAHVFRHSRPTSPLSHQAIIDCHNLAAKGAQRQLTSRPPSQESRTNKTENRVANRLSPPSMNEAQIQRLHDKLPASPSSRDSPRFGQRLLSEAAKKRKQDNELQKKEMLDELGKKISWRKNNYKKIQEQRKDQALACGGSAGQYKSGGHGQTEEDD